MKRLNWMEQTAIDEVISELKTVDKKLYNEKILFGMAFYIKGDVLKPSFGMRFPSERIWIPLSFLGLFCVIMYSLYPYGYLLFVNPYGF